MYTKKICSTKFNLKIIHITWILCRILVFCLCFVSVNMGEETDLSWNNTVSDDSVCHVDNCVTNITYTHQIYYMSVLQTHFEFE